ncbi:sirohydrochlorin chelatase [Effusibacillus dendaii]|uniref:Sirohydrochlorin nickelochelatase n=1 Tax=Effusibacillus dendaii TaxID=2743772 RepID=A0A7I8DAT0_9BACL|nr:CbiX/SirB N-terminal domain-containing protein [Effusibacillus dendaii]BCJ87205.1 sirohydrochlorin nickelochelatase [Effusibacillus dendaii]
MDGILLVGHGSLMAHANDSLYEMAEEMKRRKSIDVVEVAFLDQCEPDIPTAILTCVKKGVTRLHMVPYFLSKGYLMRKAVRIAKEEEANFRGMTIRVSEPVGADPRIVQVLLDRIDEGLTK